MATQTARFTKAFLAKIPLSPNKEPHVYADRVVRGLKLKASMTRKTFLLEKRIRGRRGSAVTFKLGTFPHLSLEEARKIARRYISLCERGYDPRMVDQPDSGRRRVPLSAAIETFFELKKEQLAPRTLKDYRAIIRIYLRDWLSKDLCGVTQDDIAAKYMKIAKKSVKQATQTLRTLSTIWNTVTFHYLGEDRKRLLPTNPIPEAIRMMGGLKPMKPKKTVIPLHKLGAWVHLVEMMIEAPTTSPGKKRLLETMLLSLFLGLRNQEARTLQWDQVDLEAGVVTIHELTAKNRRRHLIPLPGYATDFLQGLADRRNMDDPYVFPSPRIEGDVSQPIKPNWQLSKEVGQRLKIEYSPHATRRTFASVANHLRIPFLTLKRLMNHHFQGGVTGGYIIPEFNPSENREEIERIARFILEQRDAYVGSLSKQA